MQKQILESLTCHDTRLDRSGKLGKGL
jgi:hypothetical protein